MAIKHSSKIGLEIVIPIIIVFISIIFILSYSGPYWLSITLLPAMIFIVYIFTNTDYTIDGSQLLVRSGILFQRTIDINTITQISETNNFLSAPATSLDRLEIKYNKYNSVLVSPKNKTQFIHDLVAQNPNIKLIE